MKQPKWIRFLAMALLLAMVLGTVPAVLATENSTAEPDSASEESLSAVAHSMDGQPPIRTHLHTRAVGMSTAMGKETCAYIGYVGWNYPCSTGVHSGTHSFTTDTMYYHYMKGELAYCIEPNYMSSAGISYTGYNASSASGSSFWMGELTAAQRSYIQQILAFGYPSIDRGYSKQTQFAATQTLIWEVCFGWRSGGIQHNSNCALFSAIFSKLGANYQACYNSILSSISISNGKVPSFAGSSSPATVNLTLNPSTNCYEGSVKDSNGVLGYYTFEKTGVTFTKSGSTLYISVPASSAASIKGQTITGTSTQKNMATSDPVIWENPYYQTVVASGGADYAKAYIRLNWEDTGNLKLVKKVSESSMSRSGWTFNFKNNSTGAVTTKTTSVDGIITLTGLAAGTSYTVSEKSYDGYYHPPAQTVTIQAGKTTEITFTNKPLKGDLVVNSRLDGVKWVFSQNKV